MNAFMESSKPSVYTKGNSAGIERVRKGDGLYAFFMEAAAIEYHIQRKCDLKQLGGLLDSKGYAIALPKDSPYSATISQGVIRMIEKVSYSINGLSDSCHIPGNYDSAQEEVVGGEGRGSVF